MYFNILEKNIHSIFKISFCLTENNPNQYNTPETEIWNPLHQQTRPKPIKQNGNATTPQYKNKITPLRKIISEKQQLNVSPITRPLLDQPAHLIQ